MAFTRKFLSQRTNELVAMLQIYTTSQKDLWRKVPVLALEADGRGGYSEQYAWAYRDGVWALLVDAQGECYNSAIDLESGKIVRIPILKRNPESPDNSEIIRLAGYLEMLDANEVISDLEKSIKKFKNSPGAKKWREEQKLLYDVTEPYTRSEKGWERLLDY